MIISMFKRRIILNKKVILSTDSTCDLSAELKQKYSVKYMPYHINLDGKEYLDNVDITPEEIFKAYEERKLLPKTAAINAADYEDYFRKLTENGEEVIHINLGGALSASYNNSRLAAMECEGVYVVDSCNLSTGIGHLVIEAAKMIEEGLGAKEIADKLEILKSKVHSSFILDTLEYMHAGGRCSSVVKLGANLLKLKPCIEVNNADGSMNVGKKYRGELESVLSKYVKERLSAEEKLRTDKIFITYSAGDPKYIEIIKNAVTECADFDEIYITNASCTISCHCGPNTFGILYMTEE